MQSFKFCHKEKTNALQIRYQILLCRQVKKCVIMHTFCTKLFKVRVCKYRVIEKDGRNLKPL